MNELRRDSPAEGVNAMRGDGSVKLARRQVNGVGYGSTRAISHQAVASRFPRRTRARLVGAPSAAWSPRAGARLAEAGLDLSGPTHVHLRYGPVTRSPSL